MFKGLFGTVRFTFQLNRCTCNLDHRIYFGRLRIEARERERGHTLAGIEREDGGGGRPLSAMELRRNSDSGCGCFNEGLGEVEKRTASSPSCFTRTRADLWQRGEEHVAASQRRLISSSSVDSDRSSSLVHSNRTTRFKPRVHA